MTINLTPEELRFITGYTMPSKQLEELHRLGYTRAHRNSVGAVVLTRAHYEAVERGEFARQNVSTQPNQPASNGFKWSKAA